MSAWHVDSVCDDFRPISDVYQPIGWLYRPIAASTCVNCGHRKVEHVLGRHRNLEGQ